MKMSAENAQLYQQIQNAKKDERRAKLLEALKNEKAKFDRVPQSSWLVRMLKRLKFPIKEM